MPWLNSLGVLTDRLTEQTHPPQDGQDNSSDSHMGLLPPDHRQSCARIWRDFRTQTGHRSCGKPIFAGWLHQCHGSVRVATVQLFPDREGAASNIDAMFGAWMGDCASVHGTFAAERRYSAPHHINKSSSQAACHNFGELLAARFFLGLFEAGCLPLFR